MSATPKGAFDKRIRTLILKRGLLSEQRADEALALATKDSRGYVDVLLEKNFVTEIDLVSAMALEMNIPPIDVDRADPGEEALQSITHDLAAYYGVLPLARIGKILTLAVSNPFDILKLDDIRIVTECEIRPVVSTERSIRRAIQRAYHQGEAELKEILDRDAHPELEMKEETQPEEVDLNEITGDNEESPVVKLVNMILSQALTTRVSDIHIEPQEKVVKVRVRQDGALKDMLSPPKKMHNAVVSRIKILSKLDIAERRLPQDGKFQLRFEGRQVDFRVSILPLIHGEKVVMRILDSSNLTASLDTLGFEQQTLDHFRKAVNAAYGMILVTGPTGSGKSTTLYSAVREVMDPEENIVTVEDPVEYQLDGVNQVPVNEKTGLTFGAALRSILRQDPDTIMIGEIRDLETADIAVKAAITGHLVLSTLHTNDAASSIARLVDMGIDPFMVASAVIMVGAQRLLRKLCEACKQEVVVPRERLLSLGYTEAECDQPKVWKAVGCPRCNNGYKGRFAIFESLPMDDEIRRMIIKSASAMDIKDYARKTLGMITLRRCALLNAMRGKTSIEEVLNITMND